MRWPWARRAETKASAAGQVISLPFVGRPVWTDRDYARLADESYVRNAVAFRCTKLIAGAAASVSLKVASKRTVLDTHPAIDLLNRPNPVNGGHAFMEAFYAYLLIAGNSYVEAVNGLVPKNDRPPNELWSLRPDRTTPIPGITAMPAGYEYIANGMPVRWEMNPIDGSGPILHVREFHPLNDWYGLSRVEAAAYGIDRNNAASAYNKALLDNGARPSGALVFQPVTVSNGQTISAPDEVIAEAQRSLDEKHAGPRNAGRAFVFGGNVDWKEMGTTPKDMDFQEGKADSARDICLAFGVPHVLIVPGQSTYNNVREAKLELWEDTILPLMDHALDDWNNWFTPRYGDGLRLVPDLDGISALEYRREIKRKSVVELLDKGVIDSDEAREELDLGPRKPEAVKKVEPSVLTALMKAADNEGGIVPLFRYLKSVALLEPDATVEQFETDWHAGMVSEEELLAATTPKPGQPPAGAKAYNPNQPRDPAGTSTGGQWTANGAAPANIVPPDRFDARTFGQEHDDPNVTSESILAQFPPETANMIAEAQQRVIDEPQTVDIFKVDGVYTAERTALHNKILFEGLTYREMDEETGEWKQVTKPGLLSAENVKAFKPKPGEQPTYTMLGGRGGSGKSKLAGLVYDPARALVLDNDAIKKMLPEYDGWNAGTLHEEASEIFDRATQIARDHGLNIVHDSTMRDPAKAVATLQAFRASGYRVEAHYMHLPRQIAAVRAVERFLGKTKRLVPPKVVLANTKNEAAFERIRHLVDKWSFRDNNVPRNTPPRLISQGGKE